MLKINDDKKLKEYMNLYNIKDFFANNMSSYISLYKFEKNEYICIQGEKLEYLYFLVDGRAKVCKHMEDGKTFLVSFYNPLSIIGDMEFVSESMADCTVECMDETYCLGISFNIVRNILIEDSKFLLNICRYMGKKLSSNSTNNSINLLHPLENRLASYIAAFLKGNDNHNNIFEFKQSYTEIAELLGTSYRHLNRTLNKLCHEGILKKECGYYRIIDMNKLKFLAKDLYKWNS